MLRDPGFLSELNDLTASKNYDEKPGSNEEESLATLKGTTDYVCKAFVS